MNEWITLILIASNDNWKTTKTTNSYFDHHYPIMMIMMNDYFFHFWNLWSKLMVNLKRSWERERKTSEQTICHIHMVFTYDNQLTKWSHNGSLWKKKKSGPFSVFFFKIFFQKKNEWMAAARKKRKKKFKINLLQERNSEWVKIVILFVVYPVIFFRLKIMALSRWINDFESL